MRIGFGFGRPKVIIRRPVEYDVIRQPPPPPSPPAPASATPPAPPAVAPAPPLPVVEEVYVERAEPVIVVRRPVGLIRGIIRSIW